jgi:diguanylate cyclase (GGDEF)-like protein/PAS domain S-box-containing protein
MPSSTDNKPAEAINDARFKAMFETVVDGVITIDSKGIIETFNPSAERLFGYSTAEVTGNNISMLMGEPHRAKHDTYMQRYLESGEARVIGIGRELLGRRKDGSFFPFELTISEMTINGRKIFTGVVRDITAQQGNRKLLQALIAAQQELSLSAEPKVIFDKLLSKLLDLTQSEYGFIGEMSYQNGNEPVLTTHAITDISWNDETREFYEKNIEAGLKFTNTKTLFGAVMTTCNPVISNDPVNDPRSGGLPKGHPTLNCFLGLPFFSRDEFVGMVGIANRPGGYDESLVDFLQPFLITCSNIIVSIRLDRKRKQAEKNLRESEARGRAILTGATEAIITINELGIIEDMNPATEKIFGYSMSEMLGKNVKMLMPDPFQSRHDGYLKQYADTGIKKIIGEGREVVGKRKDDSEFPMFLSVNHITVGGRNMFTGVIRDITQQRIRAEELRKLNADLSARVAELDILNAVNDQLNKMNSFLQSAENLQELYQAISKFCQSLFPDEKGGYFSIENGKTLELMATWGSDYDAEDYFPISDCWAMRKGEVKLQDDDDHHLVCNHLTTTDFHQAICQPVATRDGIIGLLSMHNVLNEELPEKDKKLRFEKNHETLAAIAERLGVAIANLQLREKLLHESIRDPLTKLYNRRFFDETLELEFRRSKRTGAAISILIIDADHFKTFNDSFGHEAGDLVLVKLAETLITACRSQDVPCRYGGEEFAVVLRGCNSKNALVKAEEIRSTVEQLKLEYTGELLPKLTISCGVYGVDKDFVDAAEAVRMADKALYQAKQEGRNRVVVLSPEQ